MRDRGDYLVPFYREEDFFKKMVDSRRSVSLLIREVTNYPTIL